MRVEEVASEFCMRCSLLKTKNGKWQKTKRAIVESDSSQTSVYSSLHCLPDIESFEFEFFGLTVFGRKLVAA